MRSLALAVVGLFALAARAAADDHPRIESATASSTGGEAHAVSRLFDFDEATTWCAREKAKVTVQVKLSGTVDLRDARLSLGDFSDWTVGPRVKQVYVTVLAGDKTVKKVRHKWPDHPDPTEGKVNLGAPGDGVLIEIDLAYAGSGSGGLCLSGVTLDAAGGAVDPAPLAAQAWGEAAIGERIVGDYVVTHADTPARLSLKKRGRWEYQDERLDLRVEGSWKLAADGLELKIAKAKLGRKHVPFPKDPQAVSWRFVAPEGGAPAFVPWIAFERDETGTVAAVEPQGVTPP